MTGPGTTRNTSKKQGGARTQVKKVTGKGEAGRSGGVQGENSMTTEPGGRKRHRRSESANQENGKKKNRVPSPGRQKGERDAPPENSCERGRSRRREAVTRRRRWRVAQGNAGRGKKKGKQEGRKEEKGGPNPQGAKAPTHGRKTDQREVYIDD